tara:strand:+ start:991 stop:1578 length:588 start_codon:yes stop_codon:yes gene_type:complete
MPNQPFKWDHQYSVNKSDSSINKKESEELIKGRSPIRKSRSLTRKSRSSSRKSRSSSRKRTRTPNQEINFTLSEHAKERMKERNITNNDIERILKNVKPDVKKTQNPFYEDVNIYEEYKPNKKEFELKVITSQGDIPKVITVIRNLNKKGGKTRKNKKNKNKIIKFINKKKKSLTLKKLKVKKTKKTKKSKKNYN